MAACTAAGCSPRSLISCHGSCCTNCGVAYANGKGLLKFQEADVAAHWLQNRLQNGSSTGLETSRTVTCRCISLQRAPCPLQYFEVAFATRAAGICLTCCSKSAARRLRIWVPATFVIKTFFILQQVKIAGISAVGGATRQPAGVVGRNEATDTMIVQRLHRWQETFIQQLRIPMTLVVPL